MCLQDKRWSCAGVGCADRFGIRKSPCRLRPTCLESLLGGDPASSPWSWSQAGMMSSMPAPRGWKGEGDASLWRHGLKKKVPAGHCPEATCRCYQHMGWKVRGLASWPREGRRKECRGHVHSLNPPWGLC